MISVKFLVPFLRQPQLQLVLEPRVTIDLVFGCFHAAAAILLERISKDVLKEGCGVELSGRIV